MERKARVKSLPRKNKVDELQIYCRKCMKTKSSKEFYSALDLNLDKTILCQFAENVVRKYMRILIQWNIILRKHY
jgi:hypothetical protein